MNAGTRINFIESEPYLEFAVEVFALLADVTRVRIVIALQAVSYTHLDVYKRQPQYSEPRREQPRYDDRDDRRYDDRGRGGHHDDRRRDDHYDDRRRDPRYRKKKSPFEFLGDIFEG